MIRISHCQFESWCGDFEHNLARFGEGLARADADRAAIVSFPECFLTGYPDTEAVARTGAFAVDSDQMMAVLDASARHEALAIVGFNETRGDDLYNTAAVVHRGHLLGIYSKCSAYQRFHQQGREFPVWTHQGLTFGVVICSDGGYIEPTRILAMKGATVVFAPHFNAITACGLIGHFMRVRSDHIARATENGVYFVRGNNVILDPAKSGLSKGDPVGYGDSYVMDPNGEIVVRSRRQVEDFIVADIDPKPESRLKNGLTRSAWSHREFGAILAEAAKEKTSS
jgi:predicted amidohydrolase